VPRRYVVRLPASGTQEGEEEVNVKAIVTALAVVTAVAVVVAVRRQRRRNAVPDAELFD
jgi:hypothetical protein